MRALAELVSSKASAPEIPARLVARMLAWSMLAAIGGAYVVHALGCG